MSKRNGDKKEIILEAAKIVFAESGYHGASISKIAKRAGIGDGTVYLYFKNKEDILITLFHDTIHNKFAEQVEQAIRYYDDARLALLELVRNHFDFFGRDIHLSRVIQIESRQSEQNVREGMKPGIQKYFRIIESVVERGQEQGHFRKDVSSRNSRKMIFGTLDEMVTSWVLSTKEYPLIQMVEPAYKLFIQGLLECGKSDGI
ncbi:MAG: TetR/AcrR family transcriptional regulator [Bacillaceae bacterium]|nr:TetR/AcrR family transcriptional regulator [Bacillaceae bacterium]